MRGRASFQASVVHDIATRSSMAELAPLLRNTHSECCLTCMARGTYQSAPPKHSAAVSGCLQMKLAGT